MLISIHAPAKGATLWQYTNSAKIGDFNPRSREGSDNFHHPTVPAHKIFQSTLPRRERLYLCSNTDARQNISIHAPAKGATLYASLHPAAPQISIHAPAKGATAFIKYRLEQLGISIHAPAKGAT